MDIAYTPHQLELLNRVNEEMRSRNLSQGKMAERIGISKGTFSQIISGNYQANPQKIFDTIESYLEVKEEAKLKYTEIKYADTSISSEIYSIIRICQVKGGLAVACGDAGIGKTKAARKFLNDNPTNSVLITVHPCNSAIKPLLENIADKIGASNERTIDKLWCSIANKLSDGMVLIFDEAQHLSYKAIEVLRSFSDYFADQDETLGICFIGNTDTVSRLGSKRAEFAQIANRTKQRKIYSKDNITRDDIIKLFPILKSENKDKEIDLLWKVAKTPQAIRGVINVFSNAYDNEDYSYAGLIAMMKFMDITI